MPFYTDKTGLFLRKPAFLYKLLLFIAPVTLKDYQWNGISSGFTRNNRRRKVSAPLHILMVAAENDGVTNCKVGGIGDVIRDIPPALAAEGCRVSVLTPSCGFLHEAPGAEELATIHFRFGGGTETATLCRVPGKREAGNVTHYVLDHPSFLSYKKEKGIHEIYCHDQPDRPFATDAGKFALFCTAAAEAIKCDLFGNLNVLHLHDWHAAGLLVLQKYSKEYAGLQHLRTVYTIHNLALQGIRPFAGDPSSFEKWFPELTFSVDVPDELRDPRWPHCYNPMATGIRLADAVHTVSPSYAEEITRPSEAPQRFGGESLENDICNWNPSLRRTTDPFLNGEYAGMNRMI